MSSIWSSYVQKTGTLYLSRELRFHDIFREKYLDAFKIPANAGKFRILEVGCGPGALSQSLARWYPNAEITGLDFDENFINFAKKEAPQLNFIEGDATALPFADESFDVAISNTVAEHVEPSKFFSEQQRVLKNGGVCLMLSSRRGVNIEPRIVSETSEFENEIWSRVEERLNKFDSDFGVGAYAMSESEYPLCMEKYGFKDVSTEYVTINLTPDNPCYPKDMALKMINSHRQTNLDAVGFIEEHAADLVSADEIKEMQRLINARYDERIRIYDSGEKLWDANLSVTMILRGIKA